MCLLCLDAPQAGEQDAQAPGPLTITVGYAAGGLSDRLARLAARYFTQETRMPTVVKNLGGGGGVRAAIETAQASSLMPTLMLADSSFLIAHAMGTSGAVDPALFRPVGTLGSAQFALTVPQTSSIQNLSDLLLQLREASGPHGVGVPGLHTVHALTACMLFQRAHVRGDIVPYQNGPLMLGDLSERRLLMGILSLPLAIEQEKAKLVRVLATTGRTRSHMLAHTPTLSETFPGLGGVSTAYLLASPNMPAATYQTLLQAWGRIIEQPDFVAEVQQLGMDLDLWMAPLAAEKIQAERKQWGKFANTKTCE